MEKEKIVNWPNAVTSIRLILIPFFLESLVNNRECALIIALIFIIGDVVDGFLARRLKQETYFGKLFDGITDTLFLYSSFITLTLLKRVNLSLLILLILPRLITFSQEVFKRVIYKRISYDTSVYRKVSAILNFLLVLISLIKENIEIEAIIVVLVNYMALLLEWLLPKIISSDKHARKKDKNLS